MRTFYHKLTFCGKNMRSDAKAGPTGCDLKIPELVLDPDSQTLRTNKKGSVASELICSLYERQ